MVHVQRILSQILLILIAIPAILSAGIGGLGFLFVLAMALGGGKASIGDIAFGGLFIGIIVFTFPLALLGAFIYGMRLHDKGRYGASILTSIAIVIIIGIIGTFSEGAVPKSPSDWLYIPAAAMNKIDKLTGH